uniref:Uncharacterized protein n=1 Tax=Candidatus Kentrum sp. MB TaxID=2138164 RepID=A0A450XAV2_9GAMM|nr:MAG: hypothetical protein BECKMB1821G_GA0114241_102012 [Candidatus Kentron sp. MB]
MGRNEEKSRLSESRHRDSPRSKSDTSEVEINPVGIGVGFNRDRTPTSVESDADLDWVGRRSRLGLMPTPVEVDAEPRLSWIFPSLVQRIGTGKGWGRLERDAVIWSADKEQVEIDGKFDRVAKLMNRNPERLKGTQEWLQKRRRT